MACSGSKIFINPMLTSIRSSTIRNTVRLSYPSIVKDVGTRSYIVYSVGRPCTCGHSNAKPLCDGSHHNIKHKSRQPNPSNTTSSNTGNSSSNNSATITQSGNESTPQGSNSTVNIESISSTG